MDKQIVYLLLTLWVLCAGFALMMSQHPWRLTGFIFGWFASSFLFWDRYFDWPPIHLVIHLVVNPIVYVTMVKLCGWDSVSTMTRAGR
jgi:hypothetical protein